MFIYSTEGKVLAEIKFAQGYEVADSNVPLSNQKNLFRVLKHIPREFLRVDVRYFGIGFNQFVPLTIYQGKTMDIQSALSDFEAAGTPDATDKEASKMLFVAPSTDTSPDDGVLTYSTIETIFDLAAIPDRSVVMFRADQIPMLKLLCDNQTLFDIELRVLTGLPDTDYSTDFDSATWSLADKVAYIPFLSELRLASDMQEQLAATNQTAYDREKAGYTRKTGEVKKHTGFEVAVAEGEGATEDDSEIL